jgi:carbon storage regulator
MLVLARKVDEVVRIGDDVKITVVRIDRETARIGIEAPGTLKILREEHQQKQCKRKNYLML